MTKEELKKEAEDKADIYFNSLEVDQGNVSDTRFSNYDVFVAYKKGALDFAEPREKRIAELKAQIEKMKQDLDRARENANRQEQWEIYSVLNDIYNNNFEVITSVSN